jgi:hypothetical protein
MAPDNDGYATRTGESRVCPYDPAQLIEAESNEVLGADYPS